MEQREALPPRDEPRFRRGGTTGVHEYWRGLKGVERAPRRRDIAPSALGSLLSHTFLIEERSQGRAVYRLAGSSIFDLFSRELRGQDWLTLFDDEARPLMDQAASAVFDDMEMALIGAEARTTRFRQVPLEILLLPLATRPGEPAQALGSLLPCDQPYWLGAQPLVEIAVRRVELVRPGGESPLGAATQDSFAGHFMPALEGPIRRLRHLALYLGGRGA